MTDTSKDQALENIYTAVNGDNKDLDLHIAALKKALGDKKDVTIDPARLTYGNREGRKRLQAYFRQKGVTVTFS